MVDISFKQYKMLKRINKNQSVKYEEFTEEEIKTCEFLAEKDFVTLNTKSVPVPNNPYNAHIPVLDNYEITEEGKAQISAYISSFHKWWIPLIVSIASFILSCISLLKQ